MESSIIGEVKPLVLAREHQCISFEKCDLRELDSRFRKKVTHWVYRNMGAKGGCQTFSKPMSHLLELGSAARTK